jgi:hypothetical protein
MITAPQEAWFGVSASNNEVRATMYGKPVRDVKRVDLLEWKATGCTNNPNSGTGAYADEVLWINFDARTGTTTPRGNDLGNAKCHIPRSYVCVNVPKPSVIYTTDTTGAVHPGEIGERFDLPRALAFYPNQDGTVEYFAIELRRNSATLPEVTFAKATYTNLHVWLRFHFYGCNCNHCAIIAKDAHPLSVSNKKQ